MACPSSNISDTLACDTNSVLSYHFCWKANSAAPFRRHIPTQYTATVEFWKIWKTKRRWMVLLSLHPLRDYRPLTERESSSNGTWAFKPLYQQLKWRIGYHWEQQKNPNTFLKWRVHNSSQWAVPSEHQVSPRKGSLSLGTERRWGSLFSRIKTCSKLSNSLDEGKSRNCSSS